MAAQPPPPAALPDELVEEILVRLPQDDPAHLVRAAVAVKLLVRPRLRRGIPPQAPRAPPDSTHPGIPPQPHPHLRRCSTPAAASFSSAASGG
ncbi:unnamed protein product [Urochloa humidicola]